MSAPELRTDANLLAGYQGAPGSYDEARSPQGEFRPAWQKFIAAATDVSRTEFGQRWEQAQRLLEQNSLAYPDPRDPTARLHPWELDALPLVIEAADWQGLSAALRQRARLLDLVLQDLYGPQTLVRSGVLPAEALFRHPGFLLPYWRGDVPPRRMLHFYAADLVRGTDGRWWVLADRTEAPSGVGFALQNRIALSRILPDVFRECEVERLAPYFLAVQEELARLSPQAKASPRIVFLSQAPGSVNYSEDAFLARYLGYPLAEAGDLAVRQNQVHMKTLAGLSPVDVLLRRPNSEHCDPLELSGASSSGVAGLLQSSHAGNVGLANALGTGLTESPIFMAFLPQFAKALLGEELLLPGVATWWCGNPESRRMVLSKLDHFNVKPAYRRRGRREQIARHLATMKSADLAALIEAEPTSYVAQERIVRSTAPAWSAGLVRPSYISLRAFAVSAGSDYAVMPGGLARVSNTLAPLELSLLDGERSKDAWVLASGTAEVVTLLAPHDEPLEIRRGGVNLPSRAAENFFWMGRHAVRAESLGKLVRAVVLRLASERDASRMVELPLLLRMLAEVGQIEPGYVVQEIRSRLPTMEAALPAAVFDDSQPGTLRSTISQLAHLAATVRDSLSLDSWRIIRQMDEDFRPAAGADPLLDLSEKLDSVLIHLAAFTGQVAEGMTRTLAWRFLDLGRRIERTLQTLQLVGAVLTGGKVEAPLLEALLEILDSNMTYRSRYYSRYQLGAVIDLLVFDETNPRSAAYQIVKCVNHVDHLPRAGGDEMQMPEHSPAAALLARFRAADCLALCAQFENGDEEPLQAMLAAAAATLPKLSDTLVHRYFYHSGPVRRLDDADMV